MKNWLPLVIVLGCTLMGMVGGYYAGYSNGFMSGATTCPEFKAEIFPMHDGALEVRCIDKRMSGLVLGPDLHEEKKERTTKK